MSGPSLRLLRILCFAALGAYLVAAWKGVDISSYLAQATTDPVLQRRLEAFVGVARLFLPFALVIAVVAIKDLLPAADERDREREERRYHEREAYEREKAAVRYARKAEAKARALASARQSYPAYIDADALEELGWRDEEMTEDDPISKFLNPPELVVRYRAKGERQDDELRLYLKERVSRVEVNAEVADYRKSAMGLRARRERETQADYERDAEYRRQEEADAKAKAERLRTEQEQERERKERLANQRVVHLDQK